MVLSADQSGSPATSRLTDMSPMKQGRPARGASHPPGYPEHLWRQSAWVNNTVAIVRVKTAAVGFWTR